MNTLIKYWGQLSALVGLAFFTGGFVERSSIRAEAAVSSAAIIDLQKDVSSLSETSRTNNVNITNLLQIVTLQSEQIKELQSKKGQH